MTEQTHSPPDVDRINWLEYPNDDFPYYNGQPVTITTGQWLMVVFAVALGYAALVTPVPVLTGQIGSYVRAILFFAIPLLALRMVAGPHWTAIFRKVSIRDVMWMVGFGILNLIITAGVAMATMKYFDVAANPAVQGIVDQSAVERLLFFIRSILQLFGEEVLTILPFLAVMYLGYSRFGWSRGASLFWAWILSAVMFGLVHLPSYDWNWIQCIVIIGSARLVLLLAYIKTKNIWVSTGAHIFNDWAIFGITLIGSLFVTS